MYRILMCSWSIGSKNDLSIEYCPLWHLFVGYYINLLYAFYFNDINVINDLFCTLLFHVPEFRISGQRTLNMLQFVQINVVESYNNQVYYLLKH